MEALVEEIIETTHRIKRLEFAIKEHRAYNSDYLQYNKNCTHLNSLLEEYATNCNYRNFWEGLDKSNPRMISQYLTETFGGKLDEKSLFNSMDSQLKKAMKAVRKQIEEFSSVKDSIEAESKKLLDAIGGEKAFEKKVLSFNAEDLKKVSKAKSAIELLIGLETVKSSLEDAEKILTDDFFINFCKSIDANTTLFGKSKRKLTANGKDLTSKSVKLIDRDKQADLDTHKLHRKAHNKKEEDVLNESDPVDVSKDYKKFQNQMEQLSIALANAGQITEMLQADPEMQRIAKEKDVKFNTIAGVLALAGVVLRFIPFAPTQIVGTALTSGAMLSRSAKTISKTVKSPNLSIAQKILRIAPAAASIALASLGLSNIPKYLHTSTEAVDDVNDVVDTEDANISDDADSIETSDETPVDDLEEPTIENSIAAQAAAKVGDILKRADGTKVKLTQGDINWARQLINDAESGKADTGNAEIDDQDIGEAEVEDIEDNPVLDDESHEIVDSTSDEEDVIEDDEDTIEDTEEETVEDDTIEDDEESIEDDSPGVSEEPLNNPVEEPSNGSSEEAAPSETEQTGDVSASEIEPPVAEETHRGYADFDDKSPEERIKIFKLVDTEDANMSRALGDRSIELPDGTNITKVTFEDDSKLYFTQGEGEAVKVYDTEGNCVFDGDSATKDFLKDFGLKNDKKAADWVDKIFKQVTENYSEHSHRINEYTWARATGEMPDFFSNIKVGEFTQGTDGFQLTRLSDGSFLQINPTTGLFQRFSNNGEVMFDVGTLKQEGNTVSFDLVSPGYQKDAAFRTVQNEICAMFTKLKAK